MFKILSWFNNIASPGIAFRDAHVGDSLHVIAGLPTPKKHPNNLNEIPLNKRKLPRLNPETFLII